jgi:hypothetical protein
MFTRTYADTNLANLFRRNTSKDPKTLYEPSI